MSHRSYNLRSSGVKAPRRNSTTTSASQDHEFSTFSTSTVRAASTSSPPPSQYAGDEQLATPAVQRTLYMHDEDVNEEEQEQRDMQEEEQGHGAMRFVMPRYRMDMGAMRGPSSDEDEEDELMEGERDEDLDEDEEFDDMDEEEEEEMDGSPRFHRHRHGRHRTPAKSPFQMLRQHTAPLGLLGRMFQSPQVQKLTKNLRRAWQFLLRHSFMTANVLWLLVPIGCLLLAILVPAYLTTAVQYVNVMGPGPQVDLAYEQGLMRSVVQEIVDVKLLSMQTEITTLQKTIVSQSREIEALRLLHESVRQVVEENQKKLSLGDTNSMLSIHIEHTVNRHTGDLWRKFQEKIKANDELLQNTINQQVAMAKTLASQQELMAATTTGQSNPGKVSDDEEFHQEVVNWKANVQKELQLSIQQELSMIEDRMHKSLLNEKKTLVDSVADLKKLDTANPALVSMIESAVIEADAKKAGSVDFAALVNGASVVHCKENFFDRAVYSPSTLMHQLLGRQEPMFTSPSFRSVPRFSLTSWLSPLDMPWWLSRHNGRPETALSETMEIGSCWGLRGSVGRLTVRFARPIVAEAITVDHVSHQVATDFSSAPRDFRVLGITVDPSHESIHFTPMGNYSYVRNGPPSQTFPLASSTSRQLVINGATLEITSNQGHPDYTCLYRFRVHGHSAT